MLSAVTTRRKGQRGVEVGEERRREGGEGGKPSRVRILIDSGKNVMDEGSAAAAARPQESKNKR